MRNPDVTVRSRGVMEKCTYCVQRISAAQDRRRAPGPPCAKAKIADRVPAGVSDASNRVRRHQRPEQPGEEIEGAAQKLRLLGELNTRPRTTYLARSSQPESGDREKRERWSAELSMATNIATARGRSGRSHRSSRPGYTFSTVTEKISNIVCQRPHVAGMDFRLPDRVRYVEHAAGVVGYLFFKGVGIWGINIPIGWGFAIVNFVWWIGIGHAGTLISAILFLLRQDWRTSINRFAEAMTLFAVACAGHVPAPAPGPSVAVLLVVSLSQYHVVWPQLAQSAGVGRVRGVHLRHDVIGVLVCRV